MKLTEAQIKGRIKSIANKTNADARMLLRIYMMERFLYRLACSRYRDNFIIKGGILVTSMVGVSMRSTMDIDASIKNINLSEEDALRIVSEISRITLDDDITFEVKQLDNIMDDAEYSGIRIEMNAIMGGMITPIKIDISTGDVITPREIEYAYNLLIEDRSIKLWTYNLETILAEKLQTILARNTLNTRMRDFYDVYMLTKLYGNVIDKATIDEAFKATCKKRNSTFVDMKERMKTISSDENLQSLWERYQEKYNYANGISYKNVIDRVEKLIEIIDS